MNGRPASLDDAVVACAAMLGSARLPVIGGLGTDQAGARAALRLADTLRAVAVHGDNEWLMRDIRAQQTVGAFTTTPGVARNTADLVVRVGGAPFPSHANGIDLAVADLPALAARLGGRPVRGDGAADVAARVGAASFTVFVWSPAQMDDLDADLLTRMVRQMNLTARASTLAVGGRGNVRGVAQVMTWTTGFPGAVAMAAGGPVFDPVLHGRDALLRDGLADATLWIDGFGDLPPPYGVQVLLTADPQATAPVVIGIGRPGRDHDGVFDPGDGQVRLVKAVAPGTTAAPCTTAAAALTRIAAALGREAAA